MSARELVIVEVECKVCKVLIVDNAFIDKRLRPFLQIKGLCSACQDKEKHGTTADLDMRDKHAKKESIDYDIDAQTGRKIFCGRNLSMLC